MGQRRGAVPARPSLQIQHRFGSAKEKPQEHVSAGLLSAMKIVQNAQQVRQGATLIRLRHFGQRSGRTKR